MPVTCLLLIILKKTRPNKDTPFQLTGQPEYTKARDFISFCDIKGILHLVQSTSAHIITVGLPSGGERFYPVWEEGFNPSIED